MRKTILEHDQLSAQPSLDKHDGAGDHAAALHQMIGAYEMCGRLLTSPRFNRPQRDLIEDQALLVKEKLEALGVAFDSSGRCA